MDYVEILNKVKSADRINVIGCTGSGKSTFSHRLAAKKEVNYIQLDALFWKDDWQETSDDDLFRKLATELDRDAFVLDGNYGRTQPVKWQKIDLIIWLNYPPTVVFRRLFSRSMRRAFTKETMWGTNNHESFSRAFLSRDSILLWFFKSYFPLRKRYEGIFADANYAHLAKVQIKSTGLADKVLAGV